MKRVVLAIIIVIVLVLGWTLYYTYPRHVSHIIKGVEFRTGTGNSQVIPVTLDVNGTLWTSLKGLKTFQGIIRITGASVPNPDNSRQLTINFDANDAGVMAYGYFSNGIPIVHRAYGYVFINHNFSEMTIEELLPNGWLSTDGLMISAPAHDRSQALKIANKLMKKWLKGHLLM